MKKHIIVLNALMLIVILTAFNACKKDTINSKKSFNPEFSLDKFEERLKESIEPAGAIGWTFIINQNGLFARGGGYGKCRNKIDGDKSMTIHRKINIASVSKFLTGIAVMQLLEKRNLSINSKISMWLPQNWNKGPGVAELTFADLLGQRSGLSSVNTKFSETLTYTGLQKMIDTGVINNKSYRYLNANFALFRVIIPAMWKGLDGAPNIPFIDDAVSQQYYIQYMQENVFDPIGLNNIDCVPEARDQSTLYYSTLDGDTKGGGYYGDWTAWSGGGGYFMTTFELATVLAYFRHSNVLLSKASRDLMTENRFGMDRQDPGYEQHGLYYGKNGSIINSGQGTYEQIAMLPNGIEVVVMFNTQGMVFAGNEAILSRAIFDAYNGSWE